jgi:hypothetical protein
VVTRGHVLVGALCAVTAAGCVGSHSSPQPERSTAPVATTKAAAPATALTRLRRSAKCPRSHGGRPAKDVAIALGDGPAYPVLGMEEAPPAPGGVVPLYENERRGGVYSHKTLWAVSRDVESNLVVRGASLRTGAPLMFVVGKLAPERRADGPRYETVDHLDLTEPGGEWGYAVTATLLPGPGCYAFQVSGKGVNDWIVFSAALN